MREKKSRFEVNKEVRRVLTRNGADTMEVGFQVYGREVNIFGTMVHGDRSDFSAVEIENLLTDFAGSLPGYNITGETTTWTFSYQAIKRLGKKTSEEEALEKKIEEEEKRLNRED
jgi:hypothetical protein